MAEQDFKLGGTAQTVENEPPTELPNNEPPTEKPTELPNEEPPTEPPIEKPVDELPVDPPTDEPTEPPVSEPPIEPTIEEPPTEPTTENKPDLKLDDELQKIYDFKTETGRGLDDYLALKKDWSKVKDLDLLKNKIKEENSSIDLSDEQLNLLIEKKYDVDLADGFEDMTEADKLMLKLEASKERESLKELQDKYNTPLEQPTEKPIEQVQVDAETVKLSNGEVVNKAEYNTARKAYLDSRQKALSEIKSSSINLEVGTGDDKTTENFEYIYEEADKHSMLSLSENVAPSIYQSYVDDKGELNHKQLNEDLWWSRPENRNKAIEKMLSSARSKGIEEVLKQETNVNFDTRTRDAQPNQIAPIYTGEDDVVTVKMKF